MAVPSSIAINRARVGLPVLETPILIPHRIGDHPVEGLGAVALSELWILEGIAELDLALHVMNDHVHVGHRPRAVWVYDIRANAPALTGW